MSTALKNKTIKVMPIEGRNTTWDKPDKNGTRMDINPTFSICVPTSINNGKLVDPLKELTTEEKSDLASKISVSVEDFNVYGNNARNYWLGKEVKLFVTQPCSLNLSDPYDFINYCILKSNSDTIAPSYDERYNKGTYKFALVDEEEQVIEKRKTTDKKKEAYKYLGKMESSDTKLRNFFKVYGRTIPANATRDWMSVEIDKIIDEDINGFLAIVEDKNYEEKIEISEAVASKALVKNSNNTYELPGGQILGTLDKTIDFLKDSKNSDVLLTIRSRIQASK